MSVPNRISAPVSTLAAFQRIVLADANAFGELLLRHIKAAHRMRRSTTTQSTEMCLPPILPLTIRPVTVHGVTSSLRFQLRNVPIQVLPDLWLAVSLVQRVPFPSATNLQIFQTLS